jgi:hypothetical protein
MAGRHPRLMQERRKPQDAATPEDYVDVIIYRFARHSPRYSVFSMCK